MCRSQRSDHGNGVKIPRSVFLSSKDFKDGTLNWEIIVKTNILMKCHRSGRYERKYNTS